MTLPTPKAREFVALEVDATLLRELRAFASARGMTLHDLARLALAEGFAAIRAPRQLVVPGVRP